MACKYCKTFEPIMKNKEWEIQIESWPGLMSELSIESNGHVFGGADVYTTIKIKYCPFCGEKLGGKND